MITKTVVVEEGAGRAEITRSDGGGTIRARFGKELTLEVKAPDLNTAYRLAMAELDAVRTALRLEKR